MTTPYERLTSILATYERRLKTHGPEYTGYLAYVQVDDLRSILAQYEDIRDAPTQADTLTLRDRFALAAIPGLIDECNEPLTEIGPQIARLAYAFAACMIAERAK